MNKFFTSLSVKSAVIMAVVLTVGLIGLPREVSQVRADANCTSADTLNGGDVPTVPTFNPFKINDAGVDCRDYSFMRARVFRNGQLLGSYAAGDVSAQAGDQVDVVLYIHNGAIQNGDPNVTTARGINLSTSASMGNASSHSVMAQVTSSNAVNSLSGGLNINTSDNSSLQVAPGTEFFAARETGFNFVNFSGIVNSSRALPDQQACFGFERFVYFSFNVVGNPVTPPQNPSGEIHQVGSLEANTNICLFTAHLAWSTQNVDKGWVTVSDPSLNSDNFYDNDKIFAENTPGTGDPNWISPNTSFRFTLWAIGSGPQHSFRDQNNQPVVVNATRLSEVWVTAGALNCGSNPPPAQNLNLTETPSSFCAIVDRPTFSLTTTSPGLFGKQIRWNSFFTPLGSNQTSQQENNQAYAGQVIGQDGTWGPQQANPFGSNLIGRWKKIAVVEGVISNPVEFDVRDCSTPPAACPSGASVSVNPAAIEVNNFATASAPSGWFGGTFAISNSSLASVTGSSVRGNSAGSASISGSGFTAPNGATNCSLNPATITVTQPSSPNVCPSGFSVSVSPASIEVNGFSVAFAPVNWFGGSFTSSNPSVASISGFSIHGNAPGSASISGSGFTAPNGATNCSLNPATITVNQPAQNFNPVICTVSPSVLNVGQSASFSASQGDGTFVWTLNGQNVSNSSSFSRTFSSAGDFNFIVSSHGTQASCNVHVSTPPPPACVPNINFALNHSAVVKNGSTFSTLITWFSGGSNNIRITEINPGSTVEVPFASGGPNNSLGVTANNLQPNSTYIFIMYDATCNTQLTSTSVTTPANPGTLVCSASPATVNVLENVTFTANGGSGTLNWAGGEIPATGSGSTFVTKFSASGNNGGVVVKNVTVTSGDGQTATCSVAVTQPSAQPGALRITKEVRNLGPSQITGYSGSTNAKNGDVVRYRVTVQNTGQSAANNVVLTDSQGNNASNVLVNDSNGNTLNTSGNLQSGLNLGSLAVNASDVISYTVNVTIDNGSILNTATVSATSIASASAFATVNVSTPAQAAQQGNCNNDINSCNHNSNNNNQVSYGNNSANQNIQNNINGNNNVVTSTNNNCVNNSCNNIVFINTNGNTVPANQFAQLSITKLVSANGSGFQNSVSVSNGQNVQFEITITNTGSVTANNVRFTDNLPSGLSFNGGFTSTGPGGNVNNSGSLPSNLFLGSLSAGQSVKINFSATVNNTSGSSMQNIATATSDNAGTVQASAWVFVNSVLGSNVNLSYSKRAFNDTKGVDATSVVANKGNSITYTLTVSNSGNAPANSFVITDDLSQVLPYADVIDNGGGSLSGNVISYPGISVPAGGSVTRSFRVQVKSILADNLSYVMSNTYGNAVVININTPRVLGAFIAPKTGADSLGFVFSGLLTAGFAIFKKRKGLMQLIFT